MARKYTKISAKAFETMQFNAGLVLSKFDTSGTTAVTDEDIISATTGGVTIRCVPVTTDLGEDVDNCPKDTVEMMQIDSYDCGIELTALNVSEKVIKLAIGAADASSNTITPRMEYNTDADTGDFKDVWWVGDLVGGGFAAVKLTNAISTGGLTLKTNDKGKGQLSVSLKGCVRMGSDKVPMEFYVSTDGK